MTQRTQDKGPLCASLNEISAQLTASKRSLRPRWAPREQNTEADELSNGLTP